MEDERRVELVMGGMCTVARWVLKRGERRKKGIVKGNENGCDPRVTNDTDFFFRIFLECGSTRKSKFLLGFTCRMNSTKQQKFWCRLVQPIKTESIVQGSNADRAYKTRSESKRIEHEPKKVSLTEG
jgi:hypothetical protein